MAAAHSQARPAVTTANTEGYQMPFYFFFGILGLVVGGLVTWFFLAEHPFESRETPGGPVDAVEASLLVKQMEAAGLPIDEATITKLLELHGAYVEGKAVEEREAVDAVLREAASLQPDIPVEPNPAAGPSASAAADPAGDLKASGAEQTKAPAVRPRRSPRPAAKKKAPSVTDEAEKTD